MELPGNQRRVESFLEKLKKEYPQNVDPDGKDKEVALAYLKDQNLKSDRLDDLTKAIDSIKKDSEQLNTILEIYAKQGDDPTAVSWVHDRFSDTTAIRNGLIGLMLDLVDKD